MATSASLAALDGLRDLSTIKWYVIPMLAYTFLIYAREIKGARQTGDWNAVFAGLTIFGMDFFNETWNGLVFHFTRHSAVWTTPGETALRTMVGWNIEIMFMFIILGIIYYHSLLDNKEDRILGIPNRWAIAIGYAAFCVFIECLLNAGGHLVWEYPWWYRSFAGIWLIFFFGYFHFFVAALLVIGMKTNRNKIITISIIYTVPVVTNIVCLGILGFRY
ncbi:hypothetical protein KKI24_13975 [bacterium]|nr:hypothetical protein [bacterium]